MKRILIDLSILKTVHCGLGQVALNYGYWFRDQYVRRADEQVWLLVPKSYIGAFGNQVRYVRARKIYRLMPWLMFRKWDVWHAIHQLSRFQPFAKHYILTIHDYNFCYEKQGSVVKKYLSKIQKKVDMADQLVAISAFTNDEILRYSQVEGKPLMVVYNGIERIDLKPEKRPNRIGDTPYLFSIGEIREKKNFHVLVDMMKRLPELQLYIAGNDSDPYAKQIQDQLDNQHVENVKLLGMVSEDEKVWLYRHAKAFVFPSLFEGFGLPILEAMLFKIPVICSKETSLVEIGAQYVHFFPKGYDATESAKLITDTIQQKDDTLLNAAYQYAISFSWNRHMEKYLELYRHLAGVAQ